LGAITTGLIVKAVDRAEDDALDAGSRARCVARLASYVTGSPAALAGVFRVADVLIIERVHLYSAGRGCSKLR
jgi:hypothetical protein